MQVSDELLVDIKRIENDLNVRLYLIFGSRLTQCLDYEGFNDVFFCMCYYL